MRIEEIAIGTDYEARCCGRVTVVGSVPDVARDGRVVRVRHDTGALEPMRPDDLVQTWAAREAQMRAIEPIVAAFRRGPARYWIDPRIEGYAVVDRWGGGDVVGEPYARREDAEDALGILLGEEASQSGARRSA